MDLGHKHPPATGWLQQARVRLVTLWPVKMAGTICVMTFFFIAYFWVLNHPLSPATIMPVTAVDRLISFQPGALWLYLSLWLYVSLAPALLSERREMWSYAVVTVGMSLIGLGIFLLWPTTVIWRDADWSQYRAFAFLKAVDGAANACPSLHVAFAMFTAIWLESLLRQMGAGRIVRGGNWLWCLGIVYSTIAIRQHVALDVVAGAGLGAAVAGIHLGWLHLSNGSTGPFFKE